MPGMQVEARDWPNMDANAIPALSLQLQLVPHLPPLLLQREHNRSVSVQISVVAIVVATLLNAPGACSHDGWQIALLHHRSWMES